MEEYQRGCFAVSTRTGEYCEKPFGHRLHNPKSLHQRGSLIWGEPLLDELEETIKTNDLENELRQWWENAANEEIEATVPKAVEYGSTDLIDIGQNIARLAGRKLSEQEAAELGVFFYLEGKFARWRSAIIEGRQVSDDTLLDIGVYVRMAQRIRYAGGWPGTAGGSE